MARKVLLWSLWVGFILYLVGFAPPIQPDTFRPVQALFAGQFPTVNPVMVSLFSAIGIWLGIYACLMLADGRMQPLPAWVFLIAGAGTGVLGIIPYLALRSSNQRFTGQKDWVLRWLDGRLAGVLLTISAIGLLGIALGAGDWQAFFAEWRTNRLVNGMGLAFCLFHLVFPALLGDDMGRRDWDDRAIFWAVVFTPFLGPLLYLCLRPPLPDAPSVRLPPRVEPAGTRSKL